ncbi:MAG TPA: hypothetical protein VK034_21810, partial [Enhygromyxa sp.]|nr:hypothetical protein [Enhygromyxa sp.]
SVYEVHLGSWRPGLGYRELAEQLVALDISDTPLPTPFDEPSFYAGARTRFRDDGAVEVEPPLRMIEGAAEVASTSLTRGAALAASRARQEAELTRYRKELRAGARAVSLGLVKVDEAIRRLREAFPERAAGLDERELLA